MPLAGKSGVPQSVCTKLWKISGRPEAGRGKIGAQRAEEKPEVFCKTIVKTRHAQRADKEGKEGEGEEKEKKRARKGKEK